MAGNCGASRDVKLPQNFFKGENEELPEIEQGSIHLTPNEEIFRKCN